MAADNKDGFTALLGPQPTQPERILTSDSVGSRPTSGPSSPTLAPFGLESPHLPSLILDEQLSGSSPLDRQLSPLPKSPSCLAKGGQDGSMAWLRKLLVFTGPGWLMSIAYVDPGNLEADLQCGAQFGYQLLWALLYATGFGLAMQLIAARLGVATRHHLAEICRKHYTGRATRIFLWLATEMAIIGSDIQEVIGCSIGLQMIFGLPLACGVLITASAAFTFLFLERIGVRPLELFFGLLILVLSVTMGRLFFAVEPDSVAVLEGFVVPYMPRSAVQQVVGMVGCVVMPHNLYLHSALVQSRVIDEGEEKEAMSLFTIESSIAIFTSLLINMCVVAVFAKGFYGTDAAADIGPRNAGEYLGQSFGRELKMIWALGLVAAGQSSTMTGAYTGQWVMQGYLNLSVAPWKRAIITRGIALVPCLIVAVYFGGGHSGLDLLNSYLNVLQSLVLPFALVPLVTFAQSKEVMGHLVLSGRSVAMAWAATLLLIVTNVYLFLVEFWPDPASNPSTSTYLLLVVSLIAYLVMIVYVGWVPDLKPDVECQEPLIGRPGGL